MAKFLDEILEPIVQCLQIDQDSKVLVAACDAIFNITKCFREEVLKSRHFDAIFANIITLIGSNSDEVRNYSKKVDEKIKDTVFACLSTKNVVFDLDRFIGQVCAMFQNSKEYDAPMVLIEWIDQLHSSPSVNVIRYMK